MAGIKRSEDLHTKPKAKQVSARAEESTPERPPATLPKAPLAEVPDPLVQPEGIPSIEEGFLPFDPETYVPPVLRKGLEQDSRKTIYAQEIIVKGGIADLAVQLVRDEGDRETQVLEATRRALLHREAEQYALADLHESGDIESGLLKCKEAWEVRKRHENARAYTYKTDANGKLLPIPFEEGLSVLMPHDARKRRLAFFKKWLADDCIQQRRDEIQALEKQADNAVFETQKGIQAFAFGLSKCLELHDLLKDSRKLLIKSVEEKIDEMTRCGIDPRFFERAQLTFRDWKTAEVSRVRKASGTQGANKKRKRAARPPFEELKKMGIDWSEKQSQ